jgi:hypothetical protein
MTRSHYHEPALPRAVYFVHCAHAYEFREAQARVPLALAQDSA